MDNLQFSAADLERIDKADDLKISPFRADGHTYGTPTWIWEVVVEGALYVRAYSGISSRWYQSAIHEKAGRIHAAGMIREVAFEPVYDKLLNEKIDAAYRKKYSSSPYLAPMTGGRAGRATIMILPKG